MEYNKRRFQKANDKKILHKVKKHWVVMSMALLMAIGGEAAVTHVSAHADTNSNNGSANDSTNTIKEQLNSQLVQGQKQAQSAQNQNNNQPAQSKQSAQASQSQISTKQISQQASALHQQIMSNAVSNNSAKHSLLGQGRVQSSVANNGQQNSNNKVANLQSANSNNVKNSQANVNNANQNARKLNLTNVNQKHLLGTIQGQPTADSTHWIFQSDGQGHDSYLSDGQITDWKNQKAYYGLNWRYSPSTKAAEFTGGKLSLGYPYDSDYGHVFFLNRIWGENAPSGFTLSDIHSVKLDSNIDMSNASDMNDMFASDHSLQSVDLSNLDASHVRDMGGMFSSDTALKSVNLSNFNTSNATRMDYMFYNDKSLPSLDVSSFNTSKVFTMDFMFQSDYDLHSLDLSDFDTSNVNSMAQMFAQDSGLVYLNLGGKFTTKNVNHTPSYYIGSFSGVGGGDDLMFASRRPLNNQQLSDTYNTLAKKRLLGGIVDSTIRKTYYTIDPQELILSAGDKFSKNSGFNSGKIQVHDDDDDATRIYNITSNLSNGWYKALPQTDTHVKPYTTGGPVNLGNGLAGTWLKEPNSKPTIVYSDIYHSVDGLTKPASDKFNTTTNQYAHPSDQAPAGWAFVTPIGTIASGTNNVKNDSKAFTVNHDNGPVVLVAPVYDGMAYKYDQADQSVIFTSGTATTSDQLQNTSLKDIKKATFTDGVNLSNINNSDLDQIFKNDSQLTTLSIASDTGLPKTAKLPGNGGAWVNVESNTPESLSDANVTDDKSGMWTHNAEVVNYKIKNPQQGQSSDAGTEVVQKPMGQSFSIGDQPVNLAGGYQVINPSDKVTVNGGSVNVSVQPYNQHAFAVGYVKVVYEKNNGNTVSDNVPVNLAGAVDSEAYFDPVDMPVPDGYQLDPSHTKTQSDYGAKINRVATVSGNTVTDKGSITWDNNTQPEVWFIGNPVDNQSVTINKVVETPHGDVISQSSSDYPLPNVVHVGDDYQITPPQSDNGLSLATGSDAHSSDDKSPVDVHVYYNPVSNAGYLGPKQVTFYYVNNQKTTVTVNYINQAGNNVGQMSLSDYMQAKDSVAKEGVTSNLPDGYTNTIDQSQVPHSDLAADQAWLQKNPANITFGINNKTINYNVIGKTVPVTVNYTYNGKTVGSANLKSQVGSTINLPTSGIPSDYYVDGNTAYLVQPTSNVVSLNVDPAQKLQPYQLVDDQNQPVGPVQYISGNMGQATNLPKDTLGAPDGYPGYTYANGGTVTLSSKISDVKPHSNVMANTLTVHLNNDPEQVTVNYLDSDGDKVVSSYSDVKGNINHTIDLHTFAQVPNGYTLDANQSMNYTFSPDQIVTPSNGSTPGTMQPVNLYVHANVRGYLFVVNQTELGSDGHNTTLQDPQQLIFKPGQMVQTLDPASFAPEGYTSVGTNKPVKVTVGDLGVVEADAQGNPTNTPLSSVDWKYAPNESSITFKYYNDGGVTTNRNKTLTPLSSLTYQGKVNTTVDPIDTEPDGTAKVTIPSGYALDPDVRSQYQIEPHQKVVPLYVHSTSSYIDEDFPLTIQIERPDGSLLTTQTRNVVIPVSDSKSYQLKISDYVPDGDTADYSDELTGMPSHEPADTNYTNAGRDFTVLNRGKNGLVAENSQTKQPLTGTPVFVYRAKPASAQGTDVKPITVEYIDQNNQIVPTAGGKFTINPSNAYIGESISNVTSDNPVKTTLSNGVYVPTGYTAYPGQQANTSYVFSKTPQTAVIYVKGDPVVTESPVYIYRTSHVIQNQNYELNSDPDNLYKQNVPETVEVPIAGRVGDQMFVNDSAFTNYLPVGYSFASSDNQVNPGANYQGHTYVATLTPSDALLKTSDGQGHLVNAVLQKDSQGKLHLKPASQVSNYKLSDSYLNSDEVATSEYLPTHWNNDSWANNPKNSASDKPNPYWLSNNPTTNKPMTSDQQMPLVVLQAHDNEAMDFDVFNQKNKFITTIPINKYTTTGLNKAYNPSYNDPVLIDHYAESLPLYYGYYYDTNKSLNDGNSAHNQGNELVYFGLQLQHVPVYVQGKKEKITVTYHKQGTSDKNDITVGSVQSQIGSDVSISDILKDSKSTKLPDGYQLAGGQPMTYTVSYNDDTKKSSDTNQVALSQNVGQITIPLTIKPDMETQPVEFIDVDNGRATQVGNTQTLQGHIGDSTTLPKVPNGYELVNPNQSDGYTFKASDNTKANGTYAPIKIDIKGKQASVNIHYLDENGNQVGSTSVVGSVGQTASLPTPSKSKDNPVPGLPGNYSLSTSQTSGSSVMFQPSDANDLGETKTINMYAIGHVYTDKSLKVNLVYEDNSGNILTTSSDVPIQITGNYGYKASFDPASLAKTLGFTVDTTPNQTHGYTRTNYGVYMASDAGKSASWSDSVPPTIYLKGDYVNKGLRINRVVESPAGTVLGVDTSLVLPVSDSVGTQYSFDPNNIPVPAPAKSKPGDIYSLAPGQNTPITGKVMKTGNTVYLTKPMDTLYYIDPEATSFIQVHYINQAGNEVPSNLQPISGSIGAPLDMNTVKNAQAVPNGYHISDKPAQAYFANPTSDDNGFQNLNINIVGDNAYAKAEYYDGTHDLNKSAGTYSGDVGSTVSLTGDSRNVIPMGYHLTNSDNDYTLMPSDVNGQKTIHVQVSSNQMTLPIEYVDGSNIVGNTYISGTLDDGVPYKVDKSVPNGYHVVTGQDTPYYFTPTNVSNSDTMDLDKVYVTGDPAQVNVNYISQNGTLDQFGNKVGSKVLSGIIGRPVGVPALHGFQFNNNKQPVYTFRADQINGQTQVNGQDTQTMNDYDVFVTGNTKTVTATVNVQREDSFGHNQGGPVPMKLQMEVTSGVDSPFYPSDIEAPDGYTPDLQHSTQGADLTLDSDGNAQWQNVPKGQLPTIYFQGKPSSQLKNNTVDITEVEKMGNDIIGTVNYNYPVNNKQVGDTYTISDNKVPFANESDAQYFTLSNSDKGHTITGTVTANGLTNNHAVLNFDDHKVDNDPIDLQFKVQVNKTQSYNVESDSLGGNGTYFDQSLNAMDYLPAGYHLDKAYNQTPSDLVYHFGNDNGQAHVIYVQPDQPTYSDEPVVPVTMNFMAPGQSTPLSTKTVNVPMDSGNFNNGTFDIKASDPALTSTYTGYTPEASNQDIKGHINKDKDTDQITFTSNQKKTFNYVAQVAHAPVEFMNQNGQYVDQDGNVVNPSNGNYDVTGYYGETVDNFLNDPAGSNPKGISLPKGYQYASGNTPITLMDQGADQSNPKVIMVKGDQVSAKASLTLVEYDPRGIQPKYQHNVYTVTVPVNGLVGDQFNIDPNAFTPNGYAPTKSDSDKTGILSRTDNGQVVANVEFNYQSQAKTTGLLPMKVIYLNNGSYVGSDYIDPTNETPANAKSGNFDFEGEIIDPSNSEKYPLPSDLSLTYQIVPGQYVPTAFSTSSAQSPAYVDVEAKTSSKGGQSSSTASFNGTASALTMFYDSSDGKLIKTSDITQPISGDPGDQFTIYPKTYPGYTLQNYSPMLGMITSKGLLSNIVYKYVAQSSTDPVTDVQPIYVTYVDQDTNLPVGNIRQRLDGYMNETIDPFANSELPSGYHLVSTPSFATFGTTPQNVTLYVEPNSNLTVGHITVYYRNHDNGKLVDQVTLEGVVGETASDKLDDSHKINLLANGNVPQGYSIMNDQNQSSVVDEHNQPVTDTNVSFTPKQSFYTIYVDPVVTDSFVYEDIDNDQNPSDTLKFGQAVRKLSMTKRLLGVQTLTGLRDSQINYDRYTDYLPQGYVFAGFGTKENKLTGGQNVIYVKHAPAKEFSKITVNYVKHDLNGRVIGSDAETFMGHTGGTIMLADLEDQTPAGFEFKDVKSKSPIAKYTGYDQLITIDVQKQAAPKYGTVMVHFVTGKDNHDVISPVISTGLDGDYFDPTQYEHEHPGNYSYVGVQGQVPGLYDASHVQNMYIKVK